MIESVWNIDMVVIFRIDERRERLVRRRFGKGSEV